MEFLTFTETQISAHATVITLGRVLDNNNAESIVQTIVGAQQRGCRFIIIDCSSLEFLSSAGVGAVLGTIEMSRSQGGDIILCAVSETIKHVLGVLDLLEFLTIRATKEDALALAGSDCAST